MAPLSFNAGFVDHPLPSDSLSNPRDENQREKNVIAGLTKSSGDLLSFQFKKILTNALTNKFKLDRNWTGRREIPN